MPARSVALGQRVRPGHRPGAVLVLMSLTILSLTFFLGVLAGRQWALSHEKERRAGPAAARGLKEREVGRAPQIQDKLTFYQTLTAPLAPTPPRREPKVAEAKPPAPTEPQPAVPAKNDPPKSQEPAGHLWTVQVAAYQSRNQAEALQRSLATSGYDAYVATVTGPEGTVRYRVRVGSYPSRDEAERVSRRLRAGTRAGGLGGPLTPFVAPR